MSTAFLNQVFAYFCGSNNVYELLHLSLFKLTLVHIHKILLCQTPISDIWLWTFAWRAQPAEWLAAEVVRVHRVPILPFFPSLYKEVFWIEELSRKMLKPSYYSLLLLFSGWRQTWSEVHY